jgi:hypothetical protein
MQLEEYDADRVGRAARERCHRPVRMKHAESQPGNGRLLRKSLR